MPIQPEMGPWHYRAGESRADITGWSGCRRTQLCAGGILSSSTGAAAAGRQRRSGAKFLAGCSETLHAFRSSSYLCPEGELRSSFGPSNRGLFSEAMGIRCCANVLNSMYWHDRLL